jgi:beta-ureidopropionase / N-carbamoyl-L-amino-acid hydrolase
MPSSTTDSLSEPRIDAARLWSRLMSMAEIGKLGDTGVNRAAFSLEDRAARRLLYSWASGHGLQASQDAIGNLFLRYPGKDLTLAPVLTGSHLDSQPSGGRFDGVYGVLAALEAVAALASANIRPARSIDVVAWSNEEGGRFAPGAMGSQVFAGKRSLDDLQESRDPDGTSLGAALAETLAALPEAATNKITQPPFAYLEAHIEQGPRLERAGIPVGVVVGIQGCLWLEYTVTGLAGHAGTTPQEYRRDALEGAVSLIGRLREHCIARSENCRFTVGRLNVDPNTPNTIPGRVVFTVDFRDADPQVFDEIKDDLRSMAAAPPFDTHVRELFCHPPQTFPQEIVGEVAAAARAQNCASMELVSGAFHDALFIANVCPSGMIFIRCREGISHNPSEFASPADVTAGAQVLMSALRRLAQD